MTSRKYDVIDEAVAEEIERLHKEHPNLGHEGLLDVISQQGIEIDEAEMKRFMRHHKLNPEIARQSWGWVASRWRFPWGWFEQRPPANRSARRFWRR
jgi:hypothetical protein